MSDRIRLFGINVEARHGVLAEEKTTPQPFRVDVDLGVDLSVAGHSDELTDTVDYAQVAAQVVELLRGPPVDLIEHLAERIAETCLIHPYVEDVLVTLHKPRAPVGVPVDDVTVTVHREQRREIVIALGANLGDRLATLAGAVRRIAALGGVQVRGVSDLVETDPVGGPAQDPFLNAVLIGETRLHPRTLLRALHGIEDDFGRRREVRWGPRTLDLDLIQVGRPDTGDEIVCATPALAVPHPRAHERAFVLIPWVQVDPDARLRVGSDARAVSDLVEGICAAAENRGAVRPGPAWPVCWAERS